MCVLLSPEWWHSLLLVAFSRSVAGDVRSALDYRPMTSARYRHEVLPSFRLCSNSFAATDLILLTTSGTETNHRHHNQQAAGSSAVHHAELPERFVAPPAARVNVVVAVFTFALIHCASAAAGEHLPTSAPLAVTPRVVKRSRRGATVVTLSPSVRYSTGSPSATHRIEHFQIARHADRHAVQSRTGHRQQKDSRARNSQRLGELTPSSCRQIIQTDRCQCRVTQTKRRPRISPEPPLNCNLSG